MYIGIFKWRFYISLSNMVLKYNLLFLLSLNLTWNPYLFQVLSRGNILESDSRHHHFKNHGSLIPSISNVDEIQDEDDEFMAVSRGGRGGRKNRQDRKGTFFLLLSTYIVPIALGPMFCAYLDS